MPQCPMTPLLKAFTGLTATYAGYKIAQHDFRRIIDGVETPHVEMPHVRIAIWGSTRGTSSQALIDAIKQKSINASIAFVMSNEPEAFILQRAQNNGLPAIYVPQLRKDGTKKTRVEFYEPVMQLLEKDAVDVVYCIGYMKIIPKSVVDALAGRVFNVHPAIDKRYDGMMNMEVHRAVKKNGDKVTGCRFHEVTEKADDGPVWLVKRCDVREKDTAEDIQKNVQALEGPGFIELTEMIAAKKLEAQMRAAEEKNQAEVALGLAAGLERVALRHCQF